MRDFIYGDSHNKEVRGFSTAHGTVCCTHARSSSQLTLAVRLPSLILAASLSPRSGRPRMCSLLRMRHQLLPGGPRLARDHVVHGVPNHTDTTQWDEIQPLMRSTTLLRHKSNSSPKDISKASTPIPWRRQDDEILPLPAKSSRHSCDFRRLACDKAFLKAQRRVRTTPTSVRRCLQVATD